MSHVRALRYRQFASKEPDKERARMLHLNVKESELVLFRSERIEPSPVRVLTSDEV